MNPLDRIRHLRKMLLKMTQSEFAEKLNMSRSNFSNIENKNVELTERVICDICREFNVNRDWLLNGKKPIFNPESAFSNQKVASSLEQLNEENQKFVHGYIQRLLEEQDITYAAFADDKDLTTKEAKLLRKLLKRRNKS